MQKYDHKKIEAKWQKKWEEDGDFKAEDNSSNPTFYALIEFPYPSGEGLHVGHIRSNTAMDIIARKRRREGYNVLFPIGWDAFGLPTENYAIKTGTPPQEVTKTNTDIFRRQLKALGFSFDWSREINTTDPKYYKWTQWIFLKMYEKGLAYKKKMPINWCLDCKTGLANEEVVDVACERCGSEVEMREKEQWMLKITDYAERLLDDLEGVDYLEKIKAGQRNWIGRSEGAEVAFQIKGRTSERIILMHGKDTNPHGKKWYVWFESLFKENGIKYSAPTLPKADDPVLEEWLSVLEKMNPDEDTILVGHSRGGVAIMRWLENAPKEVHVKKVILVATNSGDSKKGGSFYEKGAFNFEKIRQHCNDFVVLHSIDDEWVDFNQGVKNAKGLDANFFELEERGHFGKEVETIPELESELFPTVKVFTTRPDTLFGATYLVLAPEHDLIPKLKDRISNYDAVVDYIKKASGKKDIERTALGKEKTGVRLEGVTAINPANNEALPIYIADYVLVHYGTGAIMAVPAHDERDNEFARAFDIPITTVIEPITGTHHDDEEHRRSIVALVYDKKNDKVLSIDWGSKLGGNLLVGGGLEHDEDPVACAKREIEEETGYTDITFIEQSETIHHHYFATSKDVHRVIDATGLFFELNGDDKVEQKLKDNEKGKFKVTWLGVDEARKKIEDPLHKYVFEKFIDKKTYVGEGLLINSGEFDGLSSEEAKGKITKFVKGKMKTTFKLHDWIFSRQRYWGEPIPIIHCEKCGMVPVPESELPLELPKVENYEPTDSGESPLAALSEWVNVPCPKCGGDAKRETDTMPQWAGSSWYYLRYVDPHNDEALASKENIDYWTPVDWYNGGMEHTTLHLLYSRFWHKFLFDIGVVPTSEPYHKRTAHGLILCEDGVKMSKSKGNAVNPDGIVEQFGADTLRVYEMFMGPFSESITWGTDNIVGPRRFLEKVWRLRGKIEDGFSMSPETESLMHKTIKKVGDDIENMHFNTAVSGLMIFVNELEKEKAVSLEAYRTVVLMLAPFAPHISEELWSMLGNTSSIHKEPWASYDERKIKETTAVIVVQVNGKVRGDFTIVLEASEESVKKEALSLPSVEKWLDGKEPKRVMYISGKLVSIVV